MTTPTTLTSPSVASAVLLKTCNACLNKFSVVNFYKNCKSLDGYGYYCKPCDRLKSKQWRESSPDKELSRALKSRYNLTLEQYYKMLDEQYECCKICNDYMNTPNVDHNRACCPGRKSCGKCVRGLLCGSCNSMLGYARDNVESLQQAINYLKATTL